MKKFLEKAVLKLFTWGKPVIRDKIQTELIPALQEGLAKKKVTKANVKAVTDIVNKFAQDWLK